MRAPILLAALLGSAAPAAAQTADAYIAQVKKPGTGDDSPARLQVRRLTNVGFRPGAESERAAHETALLNGIKNAMDWEIKAFLIEELRFCGKSAAVAPLAAYLPDAELCEPAAQSLLGIASTEGADKVIPAIRAALPASAGKCRATLMRAAGSLRIADAAVVDLLIAEARGTDGVALRSLANIGDPKSRPALAAALKSVDPYAAFAAASLGLLLAERLVQRGYKDEASAVAEGIKAFGSSAGYANVSLHADIVLEIIRQTPAAIAPEGGRGGLPEARVAGGRLRVDLPAGWVTLTLADPRGRVAARMRSDRGAARTLELDLPGRGLYLLAWEGPYGRAARTLVLP